MNARFATLAAEIDTLQKELEKTNDPALRKGLLQEIRPKLREMDRLVKEYQVEFGV